MVNANLRKEQLHEENLEEWLSLQFLEINPLRAYLKGIVDFHPAKKQKKSFFFFFFFEIS
ncbi:hypothetical protein A946_10480 [Methylacidiphilum kamchatkense Kam1]|uniref:Tn3 transposase DDE domain-containing protein n=1 Tax=Methylacidiphilum kamchatkense Kam1 TaxID=1202785 RepID=A0ABR4ZVV7_9BACT|nr:hypothetical protein A946_10480 [Methylacidiphilum kamchatkense Kam1]